MDPEYVRIQRERYLKHRRETEGSAAPERSGIRRSRVLGDAPPSAVVEPTQRRRRAAVPSVPRPRPFVRPADLLGPEVMRPWIAARPPDGMFPSMPLLTSPAMPPFISAAHGPHLSPPMPFINFADGGGDDESAPLSPHSIERFTAKSTADADSSPDVVCAALCLSPSLSLSLRC